MSVKVFSNRLDASFNFNCIQQIDPEVFWRNILKCPWEHNFGDGIFSHPWFNLALMWQTHTLHNQRFSLPIWSEKTTKVKWCFRRDLCILRETQLKTIALPIAPHKRKVCSEKIFTCQPPRSYWDFLVAMLRDYHTKCAIIYTTEDMQACLEVRRQKTNKIKSSKKHHLKEHREVILN